MRNQDVPVFILCGGLGTRLKEQTEFRPKPMVPLGKYPIIWHIMNTYSYYGFNKFVLCMGYRSEVIREYFLRFYEMNSDVTVDLASNGVVVHRVDHGCQWEVTLAYTGELTMTGGRVARAAARYLGDSEHFAVTYGDGLADVDLAAEFEFHQNHGKLGTVLGVNPPSRFGEFHMDGDRLLLTHYCEAGNQPRMSATASPDGKTITFNFLDATNLISPDAGHMHRVVFTFVDANHHTEDWQFLDHGKEMVEHFDLQKKS